MYVMGVSVLTGQDYIRGIGNLREIVRAGRERTAWISKQSSSVPSAEMVRVHLAAPYTPGAEVYVHLRTSDLYVVGVENKQAAFYFSDCLFGRIVVEQIMLGFTGHYNDLGSFISLSRLTTARIDAAVREIAGWTRSTVITNKVPGGPSRAQTQSEQARHLLTLILVLSEASRFHEVMATVANAIEANANTPLTLAAIDTLVHDWGKRSVSADAVGVAVRKMP